MKKEFKVGDLVRVYDSRFIPWATKIIAVRESCILPMYLVNVGGIEYWVYPQQCRRLVRKKRREAWIASFGNRNVVFTSIEKAKQGAWKDEDLTHVREVKRK